MKVGTHDSPAGLLSRARTFLEANECENALVLGLLAKPPASISPLWLDVEDDAGAVQAVALRTPPFHLLITRAPEAAIDALAARLHESGADLPGVNGPSDAASRFAEAWCALRGIRIGRTIGHGLYELTAVVRPEPMAEGRLRLAQVADEALIARWMTDFAVEAGLPEHEHGPLRASVPSRIATESVCLWERDGVVVSMACRNGDTAHGTRVAFVYTPKELRGYGYASACVASLSERALATGLRFCCLYTDLSNPTSNAIYQRIGYRKIGESRMIGFQR